MTKMGTHTIFQNPKPPDNESLGSSRVHHKFIVTAASPSRKKNKGGVHRAETSFL